MGVNPDFKDLFSAFCDADVRFLVVGAHAVIFHSVPRYTKDLDVWVEPTRPNATRAFEALARFGAPLDGVSVEDLCNTQTVIQLGIEPNRIDVMTDVAGIPFEDAWNRRSTSTYGDVPIAVLGRDDVLHAKRAAGRPQDLLDIEWLERTAKPDKS